MGATSGSSRLCGTWCRCSGMKPTGSATYARLTGVRCCSGHREIIELEEVDPGQRAAILRRYLECSPGARSRIQVSGGAPLPEFERITARYPVFHVTVPGGSHRQRHGPTWRARSGRVRSEDAGRLEVRWVCGSCCRRRQA